MGKTLAGRLLAAEQRIRRYAPAEAADAMRAGALLVDVRAGNNRDCDGIVPGSLHIPLTVLDWRVALDSPWRNPYVGGVERRIILLCDHGCSTIVAAAGLVDLGFTGAGDVIGGFVAWRDAGLPIRPAPRRRRRPDELEGMAPPDL